MKLIFFCVSVMLINTKVFSQKNYIDGYIVNNKRDTIRGYIQFNENKSKYNKCTFKQNDGTIAEYTPVEILGYGLDEKDFLSRYIEKSGTQLFIELLAKGNANLLKKEDLFYLEDSEENLFPLEITEHETTTASGERAIKKTKNYLGILNWKFANCPNVKKDIEKARLDEKSLTLLFEKYNTCSDSTSEVLIKTKPWSTIYIAPLAGLSFTKIYNIEDHYLGVYTNANFSKNKSFIAGFSISLAAPRISNTFSLELDLYYFKQSFEAVDESTDLYNVLFLQYNSIQFPMTLKMNLINLNKVWLITGKAGFNSSFLLDSKSYLQTETNNSNNIFIDYQSNIIDLRSFTIMPTIGVGVNGRINSKIIWYTEGTYTTGQSLIEGLRQGQFNINTGVKFLINEK